MNNIGIRVSKVREHDRWNTEISKIDVSIDDYDDRFHHLWPISGELRDVEVL